MAAVVQHVVPRQSSGRILRRVLVVCTPWLVAALPAISSAAPSAEGTLANCQKTVKLEAASYIAKRTSAIGACLQKITSEKVGKNSDDATAGAKAASKCAQQLRKLFDSRALGKSLEEKKVLKVLKKCEPGMPKVVHSLGDITGVGAGVSEPIESSNIATQCSRFGGDGSIDSVTEWLACLDALHDCASNLLIAVQYPRAIEWLNVVEPAILALTPPDDDPAKYADAIVALDAVKNSLEGSVVDEVPDLRCGAFAGGAPTNVIFVSQTGSNAAGCGILPSDPCLTVQNGISRAVAESKPAVVVDGRTAGGALATYNESITLADGISIEGGFNRNGDTGGGDTCTNCWNKDGSLTTISGGTTAMSGTSTNNLSIEDVKVVAANNSSVGGSSYAIRLIASTGITISGVTAQAGNGGNGSAGSNGTNGADGSSGGTGGAGCENSTTTCGSCGRPGGGSGGTNPSCPSGSAGGLGGGGGHCSDPPTSGGAGGAGSGVAGGSGTGTAPSCHGVPTNGGNAGAVANGANGPGAANFGSTGTSYTPANGGSGTNGSTGSGGGGGGGGGGGDSVCDSWGGGGGGGGSGGCGGTFSTGGTGAGGSFPIWISGGSASVINSTLTRGTGGTGGAAGTRGTGGSGGGSGNGGGSNDDDIPGASGGTGGNGGNGGWGGGGGGGPSIGLVCSGGAVVSLSSVSYTGGAGGPGGSSGGNAGSTGLHTNTSGC